MKSHIVWTMLLAAIWAFQPTIGFSKEPAPAVVVQDAQPKEADLQEHGHYTNKSGKTVHSPAHTKSGAAPSGASAKCGDGSYSFSQSRRGTCSHHGGVASWL